MKKIILIVFLCLSGMVSGQNTIWHSLAQYDANRINVRIITDRALKGFKPQSQYIGIEVTNKTTDMLKVEIEYYAVLGCGGNAVGKFSEFLKAGQTAHPDFWSTVHSFNVVDRLPSGCADKEGLRRKIAEDQYSWIVDVGYSIVSIENISEKERQKAKDDKEKKINELIAQGDQYLKNKSFDAAIRNYENALEIDAANSTAKQKLNAAKEAQKKQLESEENKASNQQKTTTASSTEVTKDADDFWNDTSSQTPQKSKEQIAADKRLQESRDRYAEQENRFFNTMEKQKQEQDRRDAVMANSFYANEARSRAEQGISENASFSQRFENVEDLQNAFYNQANAINQYAQDLSDARMQQNANTQEYLWGNSTGADRAVGELATGVANIIGQAKAEKERQQAQEKLRKERNAELARMEAERKQKIANLRNDIFKQYPEGGVPLSRHNINLDELYFFTYWYDGKTTAKVSNVFPYAKFKDGTWAFKDKVISESEKAAGGKVTLVGYFTTKALAEKERSVFVELLPQAEVNVSTYTVKGKKWDGTESGPTDFWGNETKAKQETKTTSKNTDDFWGEGKKTEKKTETKKSDSFWD